MNLIKETIEAVSSTGKKIAAGIAKTVSLGTINLSGNEADALKGLVQSLITGKDNWDKMGLDKERIARNQELQTQRMFTSTLQYTGDNPVEPSVFYSNTVSFPYNLFDFWLRSDENPFI